MQVKVHSFEKEMFEVKDFEKNIISEEEGIQVLVTPKLDLEVIKKLKTNFKEVAFFLLSYTQILKTQFKSVKLENTKKNIVICQCLLTGSTQHPSAILAEKLNANKVIFWKKNSLLYFADPTYVPNAKVIENLTFDEASELAYFGSPVINPVANLPLQKAGIQVEYRCIKNMKEKGTLVSKQSDEKGRSVKGFSAIHDVALLSVEGPCMSGVPGISAQLFNALKEANISVILISQASSENSICFAVQGSLAIKAYTAVKGVFGEQFENLLEVNLQQDCCVLAAVGNNMVGMTGVSGLFFSALGNAKVNIKAIAQGSNERNISVVLSEQETGKALRNLVTAFDTKLAEEQREIKKTKENLTIALFGPGQIGSELISRINQYNKKSRKPIKIAFIANSKKCYFSPEGIDLENWREDFNCESEKTELSEEIDKISSLSGKVAIVDTTASTIIPGLYAQAFSKGINIITANKIGLCCPYSEYKNMFDLSEENDCYFGFEATVGAGLPLIHAIWDLVNSGEKIERIEGIFSGTLAWLFNEYNGKKNFGTLVKQAKEMGYTEPDPRIDLAGLDVARKVVILSRLIGLNKGLDDFSADVLFDKSFANISLAEFEKNLDKLDIPIKKKFEAAQKEDKVLRYVGSVDKKGNLSAGIKSVSKNSPFALSTGTDNLVVVYTEQYNDTGLSIKGRGAGAGVTVSGLLSDISRIN